MIIPQGVPAHWVYGTDGQQLGWAEEVGGVPAVGFLFCHFLVM